MSEGLLGAKGAVASHHHTSWAVLSGVCRGVDHCGVPWQAACRNHNHILTHTLTVAACGEKYLREQTLCSFMANSETVRQADRGQNRQTQRTTGS